MSARDFILPEGLPIPVPEGDGLSAPFWEGLKNSRLMLQRCAKCAHWQWGPEWICHRCHSFDMQWEEVKPVGRLYSVVRAWHPAHPALKATKPYLIALVELPHADGVRIVGNIKGDQMRNLPVGTALKGYFEHHPDASPAYSLLQWEESGG